MERLVKIQQELRIKKDKLGDKGRFKFRSAEDILEKVKPLLEQTKTAVVVSDDLVDVGGRLALKATASLFGTEGISSGAIASATGYALFDKHEVVSSKTGEVINTMSNEQCTGSASSYARKYALCGLFAIDNDEDDPDQPEVKKASTKQQPKPSPQSSAKEQTPVTPQGAAPIKLSEKQQEELDVLLSDIDAAESMANLAASVALSTGQPYEQKVRDRANKVAKERGWVSPKKSA